MTKNMDNNSQVSIIMLFYVVLAVLVYLLCSEGITAMDAKGAGETQSCVLLS